MSNERFDKFLKKNLESVRPAYNAGAWTRFQKRLPVSPLAAWLLNYGGWVVSSVLLSGWLVTFYLYWKQQETIETVQHQINTLIEDNALRSQKLQKTTQVQPAAAEQRRRVDTVYIIRKTIIEHRNEAYVSAEPAPVPSVRGSDSADTQRAAPVTGTPDGELVTQNVPAAATTRKAQKPAAGIRQKTQPLKQGLPDKQLTANEADTDRSVSADSIAAPQPATAAPALPETTDSTAVIAATQQPQAPEINPAAKLPPVTSAKNQPANPASSKPQFSVRQLAPRIGIQALGSMTGFGAGFVFDFQVTDKINLSLGLQAQHMHTEKHNELEDYNSATGQEFTDIYKNYIPAKFDHISEISISETFLTLPVNLTYYIPIRKPWSVFVNTGTQLNLSGFQEVFYETFSGNRESHRSFEFRTAPALFSNFVLGSGVQWQRKNIAVQVGPYVKYVFRRDLTSTIKSSAGVNASVFLNLFK